MGEGSQRGGWLRVCSFARGVLLAVVIDVGLTLAVWLVVSLVEGHFGSPAGALLLGAIALFALAMLPFFFDVGATLAIPLRVLVQKKGAQDLLEADRPRSERGVSLTFLFALAGAIVLGLSVLADQLFGV